jgi:hypothetical protein
VLFRFRDPLPFLLFTPMSWPVLRQALFEKVSLGEAATRDIVWHPPQDRQDARTSSGVIHDAAVPGT